MRIDETCACGARIEIEGYNRFQAGDLVESWRQMHRHIEPEPTVLETVAEPFDFAAAIRDEVAEQLRAERADKGEPVTPRCERRISNKSTCVLVEGHEQPHMFFLENHKGALSWPVECICTLYASTVVDVRIYPMDGTHLPSCPIAIR